MNDKIEEKRRLNKTFEVFEPTFEKNGLKVIGKGINIDSNRTEIFVEIIVNDESKLTNDLKITANMYNFDDCIEFHETENIEIEYPDDLYTAEICLYNVGVKDLKSVNKIRIYLTRNN